MLRGRFALAVLLVAAIGLGLSISVSPAQTLIPAADSTFVDSIRTGIVEALTMAGQDTSLTDSLLVDYVRYHLLDSLTATRGDTAGVAVKAASRVIAFTKADSARIMEAIGAIDEGPGFHPVYKISFRDDRDSNNLNQSLQAVAFTIARRLHVSTGGTTSRKESKNTTQKTINRASTTDASYDLTKNIAIVSSLALTYTENQGGLSGKRIINSDNFQIGSAFKLSPIDSLLLSFDITGGTAGSKNPNFESRGTSGEMKSLLTYAPSRWFRTGFDYTGTRARQNSDPTDGPETRDKDSDDRMAGSSTFVLPGASSINVTYGLESGSSQRPDTTESAAGQETRTTANRNLGISTDLRLVRNLQLRLDGQTSRRLTDFVVQRDAFVKVEDQSGKVSAGYTMPTRTVLGSSFSNQTTRSEYRPGARQQSGDTRMTVMNGSVQQPLGNRITLETSGQISLQVYEYDRKALYPYDKDVLEKRLTVKGDYKPFNAMQLTCDFTIRDSKSIFTQASQSIQNSHAQIYSLKPGFTFRLSPRITIAQRYGLDATYTEITFNPDENTVARVASLNTAFNYDLSRKLGIAFVHEYRDTDSGLLLRSEDGSRSFSPSTRLERQELRVGLQYKAAGLLNFELDQRVQLDRTWRYLDGDAIPNGTRINQYVTGRVRGRVNVREHFMLNYQSALNLGDGPQVPEKQREYWTASVELTYTH